MAEKAKEDIVDDLVGCALSLTAFNVTKDLNTRLSLLQTVNKNYNALLNKLKSGNASLTDIDTAVPVATEKLPSEIENRTDLDLDVDESKKLAQTCSSKVDQVVNFLKEKRILQINMSLVFKEHED